jgi:small subunit ribosomal protein S4
MGHPKMQRRKYDTPIKPYDKERIDGEKVIISSYGLRRKKEIWRTESILRDFRRRARSLQASHDEQKEKDLVAKVKRLGIDANSVDDILGITLEQILDRRLQTVLYKKGSAKTVNQARQIISHGHVSINGRKMTWPSYLIPLDEEKKIKLSPAIESIIITEAPKEEETEDKESQVEKPVTDKKEATEEKKEEAPTEKDESGIKEEPKKEEPKTEEASKKEEKKEGGKE